ncbi:hypothetical protein BDW62DRAFT_220364 [Aspergillus aurantiobrunneus]
MGNAYTESFTLLGIGLVFILLRVYVRWTQVGPSSFQADDHLMPLAGVCLCFGCYSKCHLTVQVVFAVEVSLATGLSHPPARVRFAYVLLGVIYLAVALTMLLSCQPMHRFWQVDPHPGNTCQPARSRVYVLVVMIPNVLTDLYLLSVPLPLLWAVRIGLRKKESLMALFSGVIFVGVAAIVRAIVVLTAGLNGAVDGSKWACRESFVSIIVANLPVIQPMIRRGAKRIGLSALFSRSGGQSSYGNGRDRRHQGDYPLASHDKGAATVTGRGRMRGLRMSVNHATAGGSDEEILAEGGKGQGRGQITVTQETVIEREDAEGTGGDVDVDVEGDGECVG